MQQSAEFVPNAVATKQPIERAQALPALQISAPETVKS